MLGRMKSLNFHDIGEDDGHFYVLAFCECGYQPRDQATPSCLALYFSPSQAFSRFSFQCWTLEGQSQMYHRGPDYSSTPEATLLDIWVLENVPAYVWHLFPQEKCTDFYSPEHKAEYYQARKELCAALYGLRMKAWCQKSMSIDSLIQPPLGGYQPADTFEETAENSEFIQAAVETHTR